MKHFYTVRIPFYFNGDLRSAAFKEILESAELIVTDYSENDEIGVLDTMITVHGETTYVRFRRSKHNTEYGCICFYEGFYINIAARLVRTFHYLPIALIHGMALQNNDRQLRKAGIDTLALLYMREENYFYWDEHITRTMNVLLKDPDPQLRREALMIEMTGNPKAARKHIRSLYNRELQQGRLTGEAVHLGVLKTMVEMLGDPENPMYADPTEFEMRLAFAAYCPESIEQLLKTLGREKRQVRDIPCHSIAGARHTEVAFPERDARVSFVQHKQNEMCGIYFEGSGAATLALELGKTPLLQYFPVCLARPVAWCGNVCLKDALQAIAWSTVTDFMPGKGIDADFRHLMSLLSQSEYAVIREIQEEISAIFGQTDSFAAHTAE